MTTRQFCLAALIWTAAWSSTAHAQNYPDRTVQIVVSYPAGSPPDTIARILSAAMQESFKQNVVVENRSGGGGNIGAAAVAKAVPDGYTLLVSANGPVAVNKALYDNMPYDPERDLAAVSLLVSAPLVLVVDPSLPIKSLDEFIVFARQNPNKFSYATTGTGSAVHLTMELLRTRQNLDVVHVPYRGSAEAINDITTSRIQGMFAIASGVVAQVKAGRLRAIAVTGKTRLPVLPDVPSTHEPVTGKTRLPVLPDVPSTHELGQPELESAAWIGLLAPAGTPGAIIERVQAETSKALKHPQTVEKLQQQGYEIVANTPAEFKAFIRQETEKWTAVIKQVGAKAQ
jgi:tripartite-type tricarboxylate transporter receptor subunit TctC